MLGMKWIQHGAYLQAKLVVLSPISLNCVDTSFLC